jgi:hypothetical protein
MQQAGNRHDETAKQPQCLAIPVPGGGPHYTDYANARAGESRSGAPPPEPE